MLSKLSRYTYRTVRNSSKWRNQLYMYRFCTSTTSNKPPTVVVVGGVAGGATASTRMRRNCDQCNIIMFERGKYVSFANCGLPYYVGNVIKDEKKLIVTSPEMFKKRFNIDVRNESNVVAINREKKYVTIQSTVNEQESYNQEYDKLILAVGASPIRPPISNIDSNGVFSIRSIENSRAVRQHLDKLPSSRNECVIVGGGFIGLEMAENMVHRGQKCTLIDALPHVMGIIDHEMVVPFHRVLSENGVDLLFNERLKSINKESSEKEELPELRVETESGLQIDADTVILGLGVLPENKLAKDCGLNLGIRGSIMVDDEMTTNDEDIYAVGDAVETYNFITDKPTNLALAGPAQQQARIVADNITKIRDDTYKFRGVQGSSVCMIFDETLASTGLTMNMIKMMKEYDDMNDICSIYAHPGHHADFYPNAKKLHVKLIFNKKNGRVLGAQCVGREGVVKVIDTISIFIQMKGTVDDLAHSELCYSPQHGSARGPVNVMGQIGMNIRDELIAVSDWDEIINGTDGDKVVYILDVRSASEIEADSIDTNVMKHIKVINIPIDELRDRVNELNELKNKNNVQINTLCQVGRRGYLAARYLKQNGFDNVRLCSGGIVTYHMLNNQYSYHR